MLSIEERQIEASSCDHPFAYYLYTYYLMTRMRKGKNNEFMNRCNKKHILTK
ncbi:conserved hypothetical protein [Vibrio crassostreae]|nr:conserved hypothetical protein [Vibrio crassostreae]CAK3556677.1 conserved hypothetical protein [Vibrio crassostreae]